MKREPTVLVIHAGAGRELASAILEEKARESLRRIADAGFARLAKHGALETVAWAVAELEDDPQFNAGTGAKLQADGAARLSAAVMDGAVPRFSAVVNVERVKNPIRLALMLQDEEDRVLAGEGASAFAKRKRVKPFNPITEERWGEWRGKTARRKRERVFGTVGAVALDANGNLAAATSTGGKGMSSPGRVGDSPTVAGTFASKKAAVSATGFGEEIVEGGLAVRIVTRVDDGASVTEAFQRTFRELRRVGFRAGAIGVDFKGRVAVASTTPCILHAVRSFGSASGYP
jgi:L-asparaginase